jgi:HK97 gp10 family phage protein
VADSIRIEGSAELKAKFARLQKNVAKKHTRKALRAGAKIIRAEARANAPVKSGLIRRGIRVIAGKSRKGMISILVTLGDRLFQGKEFYGAFQEFGWFSGKRIRGKFKGADAKDRYHAASLAAGRAFHPGKFFMRRAFETKKDQAARTVEETLRKLIEQDARGR